MTKEQKKIKRHESYLKNREHEKELSRKWTANNKEYKAKLDRVYLQTPKGKYSAYKKDAKQRGINFELTFEQFMTFWKQPCVYSGHPIETIGIDRIDSTQGYTINNVVPCCWICNRMKNGLSVADFEAHILAIVKYRNL